MGCILPTMHCSWSQQCWKLLHPFGHHCQHGRNNSQHCWPNNVGNCCARLQVALRFDSGDANKNVAKTDFASFETFPTLYQVTQLLESREVIGWNWREGTASYFRERERVKFIALPFPVSSRLKILSFHVLVVQGQQRNVQRACCKCRVFIMKPIVFIVPVAVAIVVSKGRYRGDGNLIC